MATEMSVDDLAIVLAQMVSEDALRALVYHVERSPEDLLDALRVEIEAVECQT